MSDEKPHVLTFESGDYYGPDLKLTIECIECAVSFSISGDGSGVSASVTYSLFMAGEVEKVIDELTAWRERERERTGR